MFSPCVSIKEEGVHGREWYCALPDWGPLSEESATKLKRDQLKVCTVYLCVLCMVYSFLPLWLKFVPRWPAISVSS